MLRDGLFSFLPELVSVRGTARRSRVVEGQSRTGSRDNVLDHARQIPQHLARRYPHGRHTRLPQPSVTSSIPSRPVATSMRLAIDLDRQPRVAAEKVEAQFPPRRPLTPKLQPTWAFAQFLPEQHLRQRHLAAKPARLPDSSSLPFRCDISVHNPCPSTMLRMRGGEIVSPRHDLGQPGAGQSPPRPPRAKLGEELKEPR